MQLIPFNKLHGLLRKISKSNYWQHLYSYTKEINGLSLFQNTTDLTNLQLLFLNNISFYQSLYFDILMGDVTEVVLDNEIYEDAYSYYKNEIKKKKSKKPIATKEPDQKYHKEEVLNKNQFVFTKVKGK